MNLARVQTFLRKPRNKKFESFGFRYFRLFPWSILPMRLPYGGWWLGRNDFCGIALLTGGFESVEWTFVKRILKPGMTVLDLGAHHGFYTVLASQSVGGGGHVIAFEPSPRERKWLRLNLLVNRIKNVTVEGIALGPSEERVRLYLVEGVESGCNSLRRPDVREDTANLVVQQKTLDGYVEGGSLSQIDFIKMDIEGAELGMLEGAERLLTLRPRPIILSEVQDIRTEPWGYKAKKIIQFLHQRGFQWFLPGLSQALTPVDPHKDSYHGNFVAVPEERLSQINALMGSDAIE